jgi:NAD(P)-dependent dehydrogenase (short-subunit alcohol dehydrogenase family)
MNYYTKALAKELGAAHKIRVNIVTPGGVETPGGDIIRHEPSPRFSSSPPALRAASIEPMQAVRYV